MMRKKNLKRLNANSRLSGVSVEQRVNLLQKRIFMVLLVMVLFLGLLTVARARGLLILPQPTVIVDEGNIIYLDSLTLEQKIAQMVVVHGAPWNLKPWKALQLGGIHLFALEKKELYPETIEQFQEGMTIPFFVSVDLEGCLNPFGNFKNFTAAVDIHSVGAAYEKGVEEGRYLHSLGVSLNFAPVVDLGDLLWHCRSFSDNETVVAELAEAYILGLQKEGVIATAKHYPGKTLVVRDSHTSLVAAVIENRDLLPYQEVADSVKAVMVSHLVTSGAVNSQGLPSTVSGEVVQKLELESGYQGLIVTDEVMMAGLRSYYSSLDEMYLAVFAAGNDVILNFNEDPTEMERMITVVADAVRDGQIAEKSIDRSVQKILKAKGFVVVVE
ncbi:TPA: hypothetical protein HA241_02010 [Candidatus Woesearchaeota archaeon]|nr:hypothetical protein [Candidatus Woesearchaeota archaeon]